MIAFTILRLHALNVQTGSRNPTLAGTFFLIWSVVEADFSICSGNIACLKPFMAAFNTSYGGSSEVHALSQVGGSGGDSGVLSTLGSMRFGRRKKNKDDGSGLRSGTKHSQQLSSRDSMDRTNNLGNDAEIIHEDGGSIESQGSRQMIIQKDVTFDVQYNPRDVGKAVTPGARGSYNNM